MGKYLINDKKVSLNNDSIDINGKSFPFEYEQLSENFASVKINNKNYILNIEQEGDNLRLRIKNEVYNITCKSETDLIKERLTGGRNRWKINNDIKSPMPGAIVKLNVKENDELKQGDVLLVLEAMKMENEIKAPFDCRIKKIFIEEKKNVDKNQLLISLECK
jgi:biotin carboxyl carrier protein